MTIKEKDYIGKKFNKITVLKSLGSIIKGGRSYRLWEGLCDCGVKFNITTGDLKRTKSCGCLKTSPKRIKPGDKFGSLSTISYSKGKWNCHCVCGEITAVKTGSLISKNTQSCGCLKAESNREKLDKLWAGRRKSSPKKASAKRLWQNRYYYKNKNCVNFEEFYRISQENCKFCGKGPEKIFNHFKKAGSEYSKVNGNFIYNNVIEADSGFVSCCDKCMENR